MSHSILFIPLETFSKHGFVKLCGIQQEQIFFTAKCSYNILYMLVELMPKVTSISQYVIWRSCIVSFCTALMFSGPTTDFERPLQIRRWDTIFKSLWTTQITLKWQNVLKVVIVKNVKFSSANVIWNLRTLSVAKAQNKSSILRTF